LAYHCSTVVNTQKVSINKNSEAQGTYPNTEDKIGDQFGSADRRLSMCWFFCISELVRFFCDYKRISPNVCPQSHATMFKKRLKKSIKRSRREVRNKMLYKEGNVEGFMT
jgi:hypothetical protein